MGFCHTCLRMFKENKAKTATKAEQVLIIVDSVYSLFANQNVLCLLLCLLSM